MKLREPSEKENSENISFKRELVNHYRILKTVMVRLQNVEITNVNSMGLINAQTNNYDTCIYPAITRNFLFVFWTFVTSTKCYTRGENITCLKKFML